MKVTSVPCTYPPEFMPNQGISKCGNMKKILSFVEATKGTYRSNFNYPKFQASVSKESFKVSKESFKQMYATTPSECP